MPGLNGAGATRDHSPAMAATPKQQRHPKGCLCRTQLQFTRMCRLFADILTAATPYLLSQTRGPTLTGCLYKGSWSGGLTRALTRPGRSA